MLHKLESSALIGILNLECEVRPPQRIEEAMPDVAVTMATIYLVHIIAINARYKNVFPVPPGLSIKKTSLEPELIRLSMVVYAMSCSSFREVVSCKSSLLIRGGFTKGSVGAIALTGIWKKKKVL